MHKLCLPVILDFLFNFLTKQYLGMKYATKIIETTYATTIVSTVQNAKDS